MTIKTAIKLLQKSCANFGQTNPEQAIARTANKGFAIAGFRASQTHLCKVEVQFSE
jgi:hypothetical protein